MRHAAALRPRSLVALVIAVVIVAAAAVWFKPWGLLINETVSEAAPAAAGVPLPGASAPATPGATSAAPAPSGLDRAGSFVPGEHDISGTAHFISTAKGVVLRLERLRTTNGPDVRVYLSTLTNGQVDGRDLQVAPIKGNQGDQNYLLPAGTDVSKYQSVVIWCERFSVGFGHAVLKA
jgi:Electron transfer DM13